MLLIVLCLEYEESDTKKNPIIYIIIGSKFIKGGDSWMLLFFIGPLRNFQVLNM